MRKIDEIDEIVYSYNTKSKRGFSYSEIIDVISMFGVSKEDFLDKLGVHTAMMDNGVMITYHSDVALAIRLVLEKRDANVFEFD